jgi:steroid delta-isomerase-like uncharacterized protein
MIAEAAVLSVLSAITLSNEQVVRDIIDKSMNHGDMAALEELVSPEYVGPRGDKGPQAFAATVQGLRGGFPDIHYEILDIVAQGDTVAVRWRWTGTHMNQYRVFPPTQKHIVNDGVGFFVVRNGKLAKTSVITDALGFLQTIGVVPADILTKPRS